MDVLVDGENVRVGGGYRELVVCVLDRYHWGCSMLGLSVAKSLDDLGLLMGWLQAWGWGLG